MQRRLNFQYIYTQIMIELRRFKKKKNVYKISAKTERLINRKLKKRHFFFIPFKKKHFFFLFRRTLSSFPLHVHITFGL